MPNIHKADREPLSIQIPRHLMLRIKKAAHMNGKSVTDFVSGALYTKVEQVGLTGDDYRRIADATELAEKTRKRVATKFVPPGVENGF
jgi:uncharacterized protein (DUF1778 family)